MYQSNKGKLRTRENLNHLGIKVKDMKLAEKDCNLPPLSALLASKVLLVMWKRASSGVWGAPEPCWGARRGSEQQSDAEDDRSLAESQHSADPRSRGRSSPRAAKRHRSPSNNAAPASLWSRCNRSNPDASHGRTIRGGVRGLWLKMSKIEKLLTPSPLRSSPGSEAIFNRFSGLK